MSRHPKSFAAKLKPFDSLSGSIWSVILSIYAAIVLSVVVVLRGLKEFSPEYESSKALVRSAIEAMMDPAQLYWQKIAISGAAFQLLITFNLWTFNILYGINLRSALIGQNFEREVNSWDDIEFFKAHLAIDMDYQRAEMAT